MNTPHLDSLGINKICHEAYETALRNTLLSNKYEIAQEFVQRLFENPAIFREIHDFVVDCFSREDDEYVLDVVMMFPVRKVPSVMSDGLLNFFLNMLDEDSVDGDISSETEIREVGKVQVYMGRRHVVIRGTPETVGKFISKYMDMSKLHTEKIRNTFADYEIPHTFVKELLPQ